MTNGLFFVCPRGAPLCCVWLSVVHVGFVVVLLCVCLAVLFACLLYRCVCLCLVFAVFRLAG